MNEMDGLEELRISLRSFKLVPVVGAGVSIAAAKMPSWRRLIEQGIDYAAACGGCEDEEVNSVRNILATGPLLDAARRMKALLGAPGGQYAAWLENVFSLRLEDVIDKSVPNAIADLLCPIVATTNYDHLLELMLLERYESVTWKKPVSLLRALQKGQSVIHLHGSFLEPESVILGDDNYNELVFDKAYLDVMRSLWIERTLLFIGCSFDGLEDPDFIRMLNWFKQTFPGTSHRHYALMLEGSFSKEQQRHWLYEFRVQVITYGPEYSNLAEAIRSINVNLEQARELRLNLSKALLEKHNLEDRTLFLSLMEGTVLENERENLITASVSLFSQKKQKRGLQRDELLAMQMLVRSQVDMQAVVTEFNAYVRGKTRFAGNFRNVVRSAAGALFLFRDDLLGALKKRGINIHSNVFNGVCKRALDYLEERYIFHANAMLDMGQNDLYDYDIENVSRILSSLIALTNASPEQLFKEPKTGLTIKEPLANKLVVIRENGIEIRRTSAPFERLAWLSSELELKGGSIEKLFGKDVVIAFSRESIFAWDPEISAPIIEFSAEHAYGIISVDSRTDGLTLYTIVTTIEGPVYYLKNMECESVNPGPSGAFLEDIVSLPNGKQFGLLSNVMMTLVRNDGKEWLEVLTPEVLEAQILKQPLLASHYKQRLTDEAEYFGSLLTKNRIASRFQNPRLKRLSVGKRTVLVLNVQLSFHCTDEVILLLDQDRDPPQIIGHYLMVNYLLGDFTFIPTQSEALRLLCVVLSDFKLSYDLVVWAIGAQTNSGVIFVDEGSTVRTNDDFIRVAWYSKCASFAADDSGGLFRFSLFDRSWDEIDRQESKILALASVVSK